VSDTPRKRGRPSHWTAPATPIEPPRTRPRYEYDMISSDWTMALGEDMTVMGADGWRYVGVFVRFDTVYIIFEREIQ